MAEALSNDDSLAMLTNNVTLNNHCPIFKSYGKMPENSKDFTGSLNQIKKWVVLEKIHGSNFSITVWQKSDKKEDIGVKLGRRTAYLSADEKFFKIETQLEFQERLRQCAVNAWKSIHKMDGIDQIEAMTIFGELFGGYYPHDSVVKVAGVCQVQKEVAYCPEIRFCGFDIALFKPGDIREYMDYDKVMAVLSEAGFMYSKPLSICSYEEAVNYKIGFTTHLPAQFGLPPIKNNLAEGVVIKPMKNIVMETKTKHNVRLIFKKKIDKFSERKAVGKPEMNKKEKETKSPNAISSVELLKYEMYALITEQRLINAISKIGLPYDGDETKWLEIKEMIEIDVKETLQDENEELWKTCPSNGIKQIMKEVRSECNQLITDYRKKLDK